MGYTSRVLATSHVRFFPKYITYEWPVFSEPFYWCKVKVETYVISCLIQEMAKKREGLA